MGYPLERESDCQLERAAHSMTPQAVIGLLAVLLLMNVRITMYLLEVSVEKIANKTAMDVM